ncbi:hypothetical protein SKAU_G00102470 [Synaphobranchus kaupii]|uniref:Uncharacterized protein n=1 Tax=Synaphobranchus kaupii TaxID=118154 RepID=A0A9Q1J790_SYNKA|nr:hypothetical protein SKAU_G00102470 [Synaphobranchus kaupii]
MFLRNFCTRGVETSFEKTRGRGNRIVRFVGGVRAAPFCPHTVVIGFGERYWSQSEGNRAVEKRQEGEQFGGDCVRAGDT